MATKVVLELDVRAGELDQLNQELKQTEKQFDRTQQAANETSASLKDVGENGGAISVLDSLTGGLATQIKDAAEATKVFNLTLKGTRTALLATGIGALVIGLAALVAYWDEIKIAVTGINENLEDQKLLQEGTLGLLEAQLAIVDKRIEQAEAEGKATDELRQQQQAITERLFEQNQLRQQIIKAQIAEVEATSTQLNLNTALAGVLGFLKNGFEGVAQASIQLGKEQVARLEELRTQLAETELKALDLQFALTGRPVSGEEPVFDTPEVNPLFKSAAALSDGIIELKRQEQRELTRLEEDGSAARQMLSRYEMENRMEMADAIGSALNGLSALAGENAEAQKAIGIAQAIIDTYIGANKALAQGGLVGGIAAAGIIATGLANVATIASTQIPRSLGGGGSSFGGGGGRGATIPAQPSFNVVGNTGINQLGQAINGQGDNATRAYVVFGDIERASQIENQAVREASL